MLATFCLRLACGLAAALVLLSAAQVAPRFYRTQFLTVLGLVAGAAFFLWSTADAALLLTLGGGLLLAFGGSVVWTLEGAPGGKSLIALTLLLLAGALVLNHAPGQPALSAAADDWSSAAVLGAATSAMLMGHSYLVAPAMSITPLRRLLVALFVAIALRMAFAGVQLWWLTADHAATTGDIWLWLPVRWGLGFVGPLVLGAMAWQCARLRSTQSATGILYVVVVLCFIGELTAQLLPGQADWGR